MGKVFQIKISEIQEKCKVLQLGWNNPIQTEVWPDRLQCYRQGHGGYSGSQTESVNVILFKKKKKC